MKKYLLILAIAPFIFSCNQKKVDELENQVSTLSTKNSEYEQVMAQRDNEINEYFSTMNEVEANLQEIKKQEGIITTNLNTEGANQKENIKNSISSLNDLIQKNKALVADLDKKYKNANFKIKELDKMIAGLNEQITTKETELLTLKADLERSNYQVATLTTELSTVSDARMMLEQENVAQSTVIATQTEDLNTAYYVSGNYKELKEKGVVDKEGGFIGIGASKELVADFNSTAFTKIDIRDFKELPLNAKSAKIITPHTSSSYQLVEVDKKVDELVISNPNEFWKTSKYLVVLTD